MKLTDQEVYKVSQEKEAMRLLCNRMVEENPYIDVGVLRTYHEQKAVMFYRHPDLTLKGIEFIITFDRYRAGGTTEDSIQVHMTGHYPYDNEPDREPGKERIGYIKAPRDLELVTRRLVSALSKKRNEFNKGRYTHKVRGWQKANEMLDYLVGIRDQALGILELPKALKMKHSTLTADITLRTNLTIRMHIQGDDQIFMYLTMFGSCTTSDILESVQMLKDKGYAIHEFEYKHKTLSHLKIRMDILNNYSPDLFTDIQQSRIFQRQIANELQDL